MSSKILTEATSYRRVIFFFLIFSTSATDVFENINIPCLKKFCARQCVYDSCINNNNNDINCNVNNYNNNDINNIITAAVNA